LRKSAIAKVVQNIFQARRHFAGSGVTARDVLGINRNNVGDFYFVRLTAFAWQLIFAGNIFR
jgi:hypothetical protein